MKKVITVIMLIVSISTLLANMSTAFAAGKEAIGETTLPLSKAGSYNHDLDEKITSVWEGETTEQFTAVDYAYNGWLIGPSSKSDALLLGKESHHIPVYGAEVLDESRMPKEVLEMFALAKSGKISKDEFQLWFAQFIVGNITTLEMISGVYATTLNAEVYSAKLHGQPLATLQLGPKKASYWNIYERSSDGKWTICRQPATNNGGKKPDQTKAPENKDPAPVWEDPTVKPTTKPTEQPWADVFNFEEEKEDKDPAPVWEDPLPATTPAPKKENKDPAPVWETAPTPAPKKENKDPAPVFESSNTQSSTPTEEPWADVFNFDD